MFKQFAVLRSLVLICVIVLTAFGGASVMPVSASSVASLHILNPVDGIVSGQMITRCVDGGQIRRMWTIEPSRFYAVYKGDVNPVNCGPYSASTQTYGLVFYNAGVTPGTWITQCRSSHPHEEFVFRVTNWGDGYSYAPYQYTQTNPNCP